MVCCVRLWRGEWKKSVDQEWDFMTDPEDYGYRVLVSKSASFEAVDQLVHRRYSLGPRTPVVVSYRLPSCLLVPQGNKTPPLKINDTAQLSMVLNVRTWLDELALLVTIGAKGVAEYQFLCRTNFTIGATSYVFDECATDNSRAAYESVGAAANAPSGRNAQAEAPPIFWDVGMNVVDYTARRDSPLPSEARVENGMMFWEGLANEEVTLAGETNVVMEAENLNVGVEVGVTDNIALANNVVTPTAEAVRVDDGGGSSTGSTDLILTTGRHQVKLPNNVQVGNEESPIIHGPSRELVAAQGLVLASTAVAGSGRTVSDATLPSMMKLAMCCAVKEGGTSRAVNRATETSSEGSTTDAYNIVVNIAVAYTKKLITVTRDALTLFYTEDIGNYGNEVAVGMMFRNKDAFKQHMALYAISRKFQYRSRKSEPGLMVLECCGDDCPWRVYAVKLKEADVFEIRKVVPDHLCTVDERGGYQTQATSSVIGELMRMPDFTGLSDLATDFSGMRLCPPLTRRPPGRPKKQRFFSRGEKIMKRMRRRTVCSRCKGFGHNKATCKEAI
ncbi:hypothetical protein DY000_02056949 [Brassica cretica]|uniref:Transposase MuDR plant domain-containing protein n=1 Tax=Brassica cretica TaxID=69181 RepID=A0ABQ7AAI3_BRACR|nr:hypothetical protein DY000_02056949 [Brassica cretica]